MSRYRQLSRADEERWVESPAARKDDYVFGFEAPIDGRWIHLGNVGLHGIDWKHSNAAFGIVIGEKQYWGQGYGKGREADAPLRL